MIDHMDEMDGDPDLELHGDEMDGHNGEDEFIAHRANWLGNSGCPMADPGEDGGDSEEEH